MITIPIIITECTHIQLQYAISKLVTHHDEPVSTDTSEQMSEYNQITSQGSPPPPPPADGPAKNFSIPPALAIYPANKGA